MVYSNDTKSYGLVGVTSFFENCTSSILFTRIAPHLDRILKITDDSPCTATSVATESTTATNTVSSSAPPLTTPSTTSEPTTTPQTTTADQTTTTQNNAIVIKSKLFLVSTIYMLCNFI